jgi:exosortase
VTATPDVHVDRRNASAWRAPAASWAALAAAAVLVYSPVVAKLCVDWWSVPDYSHGLLCAPLAVGVALSRVDALRQLPRAPRTVGLAGAIVAIALLGVGVLGAELFLTRVSLLLFIASAIVYLLGWRHLRALTFPIALLVLSVPIPAILITRITLPLQLTASIGAETALRAADIPVLRDGNVLALPNATLQVADACSGIRSLVSLMVLGLVIGQFAMRNAEWGMWNADGGLRNADGGLRIAECGLRNAERGIRNAAARIGIVLMAVPVAIVVNMLRVSGTAAATYRYGTVAAEGMVHEITGILTFVIASTLLIACARAFGAALRIPSPSSATRNPESAFRALRSAFRIPHSALDGPGR